MLPTRRNQLMATLLFNELILIMKLQFPGEMEWFNPSRIVHLRNLH